MLTILFKPFIIITLCQLVYISSVYAVNLTKKCSPKLNPNVCLTSEFEPADQFLLAVSQGQLYQAKQLFAHYQLNIHYRSLLPFIVKQAQVRADISYPFMNGKNSYQFASGTAFDIALSHYNRPMVEWLLSQGASPAKGYFSSIINNAQFSGVYPDQYLQLSYRERIKIIAVGYVLAVAARQNNVKAVRQLLAIEPRAIHYQGNIILAKAMNQGKWAITHLILDRGRDVALLSHFLGLFSTVLRSEPIQYGLLHKLLRFAQQKPNFNFDSLVKMVIEKKDQKALGMLVRAGAKLDPKRGPSILYSLLNTNDLMMAKALLQLGANPNLIYASESLLRRAIKHEKIDFVKLLLAHHAKPNEFRPGKSNLEVAMSKKSMRYVILLLKSGANANQIIGGSYEAKTPLIIAVQQVRPALVQLLIKAGAKLNEAPSYSQNTALHIATQKADSRLMGLLLKAGANPNVRNQQRETPLLVATKLKNESLVRLLLRYKPNINLLDASGKTALHAAVSGKNLPIVRLLLSVGAKPNTTTIDGSTPLLEALLIRRPQMARLLIARGANVNAVSNARETPLDIAKKRGLLSMIAFIKQKGGKTARQLGANPEHLRVRRIAPSL